jgi:hypothetical protein
MAWFAPDLGPLLIGFALAFSVPPLLGAVATRVAR